MKQNLYKEVQINEDVAKKALLILGQTQQHADFLAENMDVRIDLSKKLEADKSFAQQLLDSLNKSEI